MFGKVLFPTDFSEISLYALENCVPRIKAEEVIVVHVIEYVQDLKVLEKLQMEAKKKMDEVVEKLKEKGVNAKGFVTIGSVAPAISREARCPSMEIIDRAYCEMVDLIVIPSKGKHAKRIATIGSTALNVVRRSGVPVLVVRCDYKNGEIECECVEEIFKRPLIALDLSQCSDVVTSFVRKFEEEVEKATLLHVIDYGSIEELDELVSNAKNALSVHAEKFKFDSEIIVETGDPANEIVSKAVERKNTLIVIGKTGRSLIREILLGSVATEAVKKSKVPTLVVPCK